jgi:dTDP-4-amino-4,6-dideoxygalactose transaminase
MNVPYADLYAEYLECQRDIDSAIGHCIKNSFFINGPMVESFEEAWAEQTKSECCAGVSSGTSALMLALSTLDIGPGDEVIVPSMSFISTAEVVNQLGARPVFVDIDQYHTIDIDACQQAITVKTKAIIFVDLYGQTIDIKRLHAIADGVPLIRDAAQSAGCQYLPGDPDKLVHATCWSFYPGKNLSTMGDAGAVTGSKVLCDRIRILRDHGRVEKYVHVAMGWNERLDAMQAAILSSKMFRLQTWNFLRRRNAQIYRDYLPASVDLPQENPVSTHVYNQFVIGVDRRDELRAWLKERGIEAGIQFPMAMHQQPVYAAGNHKLPVSERLAERCLSLPVHGQLTVPQIRYVSDAIAEFLSLPYKPE